MLISRMVATFMMAGFCATQCWAQDVDSDAISLELNRIKASSEGGCQVVFLGTNNLNAAIDNVTWRLAVLDRDKVFSTLLALPLGSLAAGKRRIVQFSLPDACDDISEIIVNDAAVCEIGGTKSDQCVSKLNVGSRTEIAFGL